MELHLIQMSRLHVAQVIQSKCQLRYTQSRIKCRVSDAFQHFAIKQYRILKSLSVCLAASLLSCNTLSFSANNTIETSTIIFTNLQSATVRRSQTGVQITLGGFKVETSLVSQMHSSGTQIFLLAKYLWEIENCSVSSTTSTTVSGRQCQVKILSHLLLADSHYNQNNQHLHPQDNLDHE